jgi:hypothetical protein
MTDEQLLLKRYNVWRTKPHIWVQDTFGGKIKLSNQQEHACKELGKIIYCKIQKSIGKKLNTEQERYSNYIGVDISSGMGSGKDFWVSLMLYFFLMVFPEEGGQSPHVLATANTAKQLSNVLWRQAASIPALSNKLDPNNPHSKTILEDMFVCQSEKIYRREREGKTFYAEAITVSPNASTDDQAKALTGRHAPYMLMILDEAAGLPEAVFTNLEGTLSGRVNLIIMIYNPIKSTGYAINARKNERWLSITWNTEKTFFDNPALDNPIKSRNKDLLERYGRDSNAYRIRVLGLPPYADTDVFIPYSWVQDAVYSVDHSGKVVSGRDLTPLSDDPIIMGVDPGAGGDNSAVAVRQGPKILGIHRFNTADPEEFARKVIDIWHRYEPIIINIDSIGIGWGAAGTLRTLGYRTEMIDVRRTARNRDEYDLIRDELWGTLKQNFQDGTISIPNDQELIDQISNIKVKDYDRHGRAKMPKKKEMRKEESLGGSPDEAEAICMTYAIDDSLLKRITQTDEDEERENARKKTKTGRNKRTGY